MTSVCCDAVFQVGFLFTISPERQSNILLSFSF